MPIQHWHRNTANLLVDGENDWMDVEGGRASVVELNKAGNNNAKVHVVPRAGHHVYLDNHERTNQIIDEALKALPRPVKV